ncbi:potassium-transporting ATPase subunit F [Gordonia sp. CPCC 206044]
MTADGVTNVVLVALAAAVVVYLIVALVAPERF